jgi:hydrogenase expression/formation protein HypC
MRVISITGPLGQVEEGGVRRDVRVDLVEGVAVGDYVIVHAGIAIERLDAEEAEETRRLFAEMFDGEPEGTAQS